MAKTDVVKEMEKAILKHGIADATTPVLLMVSGGSDSTALAYAATELREQGVLDTLGIMHMNHMLRGKDSDGDEAFVASLADALGIRLFSYSIDIGALVEAENGNMEDIARRERYRAAREALAMLCADAGASADDGRIFVAHTADDRVESFYMRSIVGTGPGGFRSMRWRNGDVCRPLLGLGRQDLRDYIFSLDQRGVALKSDDDGGLWREDATNAHTDRFRAYVRHEIMPKAKERNPRLLFTLSRTMDLIAEEDDYMDAQCKQAVRECVEWLAEDGSVCDAERGEASGALLRPPFGRLPLVIARRAATDVLETLLGYDARVTTASVEAVLAGFMRDGEEGTKALDGVGTKPRGGYVANIQGDLAVSANKHGVRIESMDAFRTRRKRN